MRYQVHDDFAIALVGKLYDRLVWFKAPDDGQDVRGALTDFALTLECDLPGFRMVHVLADRDKPTGFLPALTQLVEERRVLIVIDNAESLLTGTGRWRDGQWGQVAGALPAHAGQGRLVLTCRRVPATGTDGLRCPGRWRLGCSPSRRGIRSCLSWPTARR
jgi:hypothetical protein